MGILDNLANATPNNGGRYFKPAMYLVSIQSVQLKTGIKGESFVIEGQVLGVRSGFTPGVDPDDQKPPAVGSTAAHVWNTSGDALKQKMAQDTWMGFVCGLLGCGVEQYNNDQWKQVSENVLSGAANGTVMLLECFNITTRSGNPFTKHVWRRVATEADYAEFGVAA